MSGAVIEVKVAQLTEPDEPRYEIIASPGVRSAWDALTECVNNEITGEVRRAAMERLEQELMLMPQADHGLEHLFLPGLYIRVARIQRGTLFTTPEYREECILTMLSGRLVIITADSAVGIVPPEFTFTKVGTKRVIFAVDDVVAHTVHPNPDNERDITKLEARIGG